MGLLWQSKDRKEDKENKSQYKLVCAFQKAKKYEKEE